MIGEAGFDDDDVASVSVGNTVNSRVPKGIASIKMEESNTNGAVPRLWGYCEGSKGVVKLILPDARQVPYYLPTPRGSNKDPVLEAERQKTRMERSVMNSIVDSVFKPDRIVRVQHPLNKRER